MGEVEIFERSLFHHIESHLKIGKAKLQNLRQPELFLSMLKELFEWKREMRNGVRKGS